MDTEVRRLTTAFELAAAAAELLRQVRDELAALRREQGDLGIEIFERLDNLAARARPMTDQGVAAADRTFIETLSRGWGTKPFLASELISWCEQEVTSTQREVFSAARALCGLSSGADLTAQNLGCALRTLVPKLRIAGSRRGSALWQLRDSRD